MIAILSGVYSWTPDIIAKLSAPQLYAYEVQAEQVEKYKAYYLAAAMMGGKK